MIMRLLQRLLPLVKPLAAPRVLVCLSINIGRLLIEIEGMKILDDVMLGACYLMARGVGNA